MCANNNTSESQNQTAKTPTTAEESFRLVTAPWEAYSYVRMSTSKVDGHQSSRLMMELRSIAKPPEQRKTDDPRVQSVWMRIVGDHFEGKYVMTARWAHEAKETLRIEHPLTEKARYTPEAQALKAVLYEDATFEQKKQFKASVLKLLRNSFTGAQCVAIDATGNFFSPRQVQTLALLSVFGTTKIRNKADVREIHGPKLIRYTGRDYQEMRGEMEDFIVNRRHFIPQVDRESGFHHDMTVTDIVRAAMSAAEGGVTVHARQVPKAPLDPATWTQLPHGDLVYANILALYDPESSSLREDFHPADLIRSREAYEQLDDSDYRHAPFEGDAYGVPGAGIELAYVELNHPLMHRTQTSSKPKAPAKRDWNDPAWSEYKLTLPQGLAS